MTLDRVAQLNADDRSGSALRSAAEMRVLPRKHLSNERVMTPTATEITGAIDEMAAFLVSEEARYIYGCSGQEWDDELRARILQFVELKFAPFVGSISNRWCNQPPAVSYVAADGCRGSLAALMRHTRQGCLLLAGTWPNEPWPSATLQIDATGTLAFTNGGYLVVRPSSVELADPEGTGRQQLIFHLLNSYATLKVEQLKRPH